MITLIHTNRFGTLTPSAAADDRRTHTQRTHDATAARSDAAITLAAADAADDLAALRWWNSLTSGERVYWMDAAENTGVAADAWAAFKRARVRK